MTDRDPLYRRHRFLAEIIAHAVWLWGQSRSIWLRVSSPLRLDMVMSPGPPHEARS
nr:hypothetical protein [Peteryoungia desertarenae]